MNLAARYINQVTKNKVRVCEYVRLAIERHLSDLKRQSNRSFKYYFDEQEAQRAIDFIKILRHTKGAKAGQLFDLQPFQAFVAWSVFGWRKKSDGFRRFRKVYKEIARKNGKTEFAAAIALCCFFLDYESGAEIYTAATKRDQASICFDAIKMMVRKLRRDSDSVKKTVGIHTYNIHIVEDGRKIEPLASDYDSLDGLSPHCAIIDEYHAHKTDSLLKVLETGMGARDQPLLFIITTAGTNVESPCYKYRKMCIEVLRGIKQDDSLFAIIYTLDKGDKYQIKRNWIKANPGLKTILKPDFLPNQLTTAKNEGVTAEIHVKTKNFNIWTTTSTSFISDEKWTASGSEFSKNSMRGAECWGGLDLASNKDITAFVLFFPDEEEAANRLLCWFWCPLDTAKQRSKTDGVDYLQWAKDGWLTLTPGNVVDQKYIIRDILAIAEDYQIKAINYDRWNASQIVIELEDEGAPMFPYGQGYSSMSAPTKELEKQILAKELNHGNNPVLRWMASNVSITSDPADNIKIDKKKSSEKVDGMVSAVMAVAGWMSKSEDDNTSAYETEDLVVV